MGGMIKVNKRGLVYEGSNNTAMAFPDLNLTQVPPGALIPIPYANIAVSKKIIKPVKTVKVLNNVPMTKGAKYPESKGAEPAKAGVLSGKKNKELTFISYSFNVKAEGLELCRVADQTFHNANNCPGITS